MKKDEGCKGCPFEKQHDSLFPARINNPKLVVLTDYPTEKACDEETPYGGDSGAYLANNLIPLSGLSVEDVQVDYALHCRMPFGYQKRKGAKANIEKALQQCSRYLTIPGSAQAVVLHGDIVARHYGRVPHAKIPNTFIGSDDMRGFLGNDHLQGKPTYIVKGTTEIMTDMRMIIPTKSDWRKLQAYLKGQWPKEIPHREIAHGGMNTMIDEIIGHGVNHAKVCVVDTEYDNKDDTHYPGKLTMIGLLFWDGKTITGVQFPWNSYQEYQKHAVIHALRQVFTSIPTVMHNLMADVPVLESVTGLAYEDYKQIYDTMLLHALLYAEWPHDLGFLESLYSPYDKLKHLSTIDPFLYNWGDCLSTLSAFTVLWAEIQKDPDLLKIFHEQSLALSPPRLEARRVGARVDRAFLAKWFKEMSIRKEYARQAAVAWCGYDINPGSPLQCITHLLHEGFALKKNRKTGSYSLDEDIVATLRRMFIDFDPEEEKNGITPDMLDTAIQNGGHGLLEARRAYQVAADIKSDYLTPLIKAEFQKKAKTLLEVPEEWFVDRVYCTQHIHTQTSGRWSTVKPALPLIPPKLRKMLIPDEGWVLLKFDWDQIELRIGSALANDKETLEAFDNKWDLHTLNACDIFGMEYPPDKRDPHKSEANKEWREKYGWEGKDDKRRVFSKGFVYRLRYRGDARYATDIPGARAMGLDGKKMVAAARGYLRGHPSLTPYWNRTDGHILKTRVVRTIYGRKRYLNGPGKAPRIGMVPEICREGSNHPMQGTVSDIFNETVVQVYRRGHGVFQLRWVYGAHDSQMWTCPEEHAEAAKELIQEIAQTSRPINGFTVELPVTFDDVVYSPEHTKGVINSG